MRQFRRASLIANLVVFGVCACIAFFRNQNALFYHFDGSYTIIDVKNQLASFHSLFNFSNDFLQSVGNIQFLQNARLLVFFWPLAWISDLTFAKVAVYLIIATMMFLSGYCVAHLLSQRESIALTSGWILGVVTTPFVPMPFFYPILSVSPSTVMIVTSPIAALWIFKAVGRSSIVADICWGTLLLGLGFFLLSASPLSLSLIGPGIVVYFVMALITARRRSEVSRKLGVLSAVLILGVAMRWPWYLYGLFADSAPSFFPRDFTAVYGDPIYVSILFHGQIFGWAGPILVFTAALGSALTLLDTDSELRPAAILSLLTFFTLSAIGIGLFVLRHWTSPHWLLPPPIYVEMTAWPLYALFAAIGIHFVAAYLTGRLLGDNRKRRWQAELVVPIAAVVALTFLVTTHPATAVGYPFPPTHPAIVDILRTSIAIGAHSKFNGRVATIIPVQENAGDAWSQQFTSALGLAQNTGNDEMSLGLWYYKIPTLFEYNQLTSPGFHALVRATLQRPPLIHARNIVIFTYPNIRILRLLGVRYVISPRHKPLIGHIIATEKMAQQSWDLYELSAPNLATYAPTSFEIRGDLASSIDFISDPHVNLATTAVLQEDVGRPLSPLEFSEFSFNNGSARVVARSAGRSLIIIPLEYSHCIDLQDGRNVPGSTKTIRLLRVDGDLTGIVFEHQLDVVLTFRTGPLLNPTCRWEDYKELKAMLN